MPKISEIRGRQIFDSRGNPTVEVDVLLSDGAFGRAAVPSGASTGTHEALELRDSKKDYHGKGVLKAISNVSKIAKRLKGEDASNQRKIDEIMLSLDGTPNKSNLGANAILGVSMACARAQANSMKLPLYKYLRRIFSKRLSTWILPVPFMNILNGGAHADNNVDVQEFMIAPVGIKSFTKRMKACTEIYHTLKSILKKNGLSTSVGDEGGFAPNLKENEEALKLIKKAIEQSGYEYGKEVAVALDVAASELYEDAKYVFAGEKPKKVLGATSLVSLYKNWIKKYGIISVEDGMAEDDWQGWRKMTSDLGDKIQIVGDDLFVTNPERLKKGITMGVANAILIKLNQIGTVTETLDVIALAYENRYRAMISHRSGETEDTFISDLAVAVNSGQIKTGAPARGERVAKYNQLLRIEEEIKQNV